MGIFKKSLAPKALVKQREKQFQEIDSMLE